MFNPLSDFLAMRRDIETQSPLMDAWGFFLNVPTLIGGLVFWDRPAGAAVAAAVAVSLIIAPQIHKRRPMSRLIGLCHFAFPPAIAVLAAAVDAGVGLTAFGIWAIYSLVLMTVCVLLDLFDLYRYFVWGNRTYAGSVRH